jgi:hypothetical protein
VKEVLELEIINALSARGVDAPLLQGLYHVVKPRVLAWAPAPPDSLRARARPENHLFDEPFRQSLARCQNSSSLLSHHSDIGRSPSSRSWEQELEAGGCGAVEA